MAKYKIPRNLRYTETHEWARIEDDLVIMGITDYAQKKLKDIVYVELPDVGLEVLAGEPIATIESVKSVEDVYAPVSGKVVRVNTKLEDDPSIINRDPYNEGWIAIIKPVKLDEEWEKLYTYDKYNKLIEKD